MLYLIGLDLRAVQQVVHPLRAHREGGRQIALHDGLSAETKSMHAYVCKNIIHYIRMDTPIYTHIYLYSEL